jgi:hypothetical protein
MRSWVGTCIPSSYLFQKGGDLVEKTMVVVTVSYTSCEDYQSRYRPVEKQVDDL